MGLRKGRPRPICLSTEISFLFPSLTGNELIGETTETSTGPYKSLFFFFLGGPTVD